MYYTDKEVREILEQVYAEAYDQGVDDTLDYIDENYELDDSFDLMDEYNSFMEMDQKWKDAYHNGVKNKKGVVSDLEKKHMARAVAALDLSSKYSKKSNYGIPLNKEQDNARKKTANTLQRAANNVAFAEIIHRSNNEQDPEKRAKAKNAVDIVTKTNPHYGNKLVKRNKE